MPAGKMSDSRTYLTTYHKLTSAAYMAIQKTTLAFTLEHGYLKAMYVVMKGSSECEKRSNVTQHIAMFSCVKLLDRLEIGKS